MQWNIADYLPVDKCQESFHEYVSRWLYRLAERRLRARQRRGGAGFTPVKNRQSDMVCLRRY